MAWVGRSFPTSQQAAHSMRQLLGPAARQQQQQRAAAAAAVPNVSIIAGARCRPGLPPPPGRTMACLWRRAYRSYTTPCRRATSSCCRPCSHRRCSSAASLTPRASSNPARARRLTYLGPGGGGGQRAWLRVSRGGQALKRGAGRPGSTQQRRATAAARNPATSSGRAGASLADVVRGAVAAGLGQAQEGAEQRPGLRGRHCLRHG